MYINIIKKVMILITLSTINKYHNAEYHSRALLTMANILGLYLGEDAVCAPKETGCWYAYSILYIEPFT